LSVPSNIKPQDRLAALRCANHALDALDAVHRKWILWEETRLSATALKLANGRLRILVTMLADANADHYAVVNDLSVVAA
jgi:hypothetical protein